MLISCNDIPELDKLDSGIRRRLIILKFPKNFVKFSVDIMKRNVTIH